MTIGTPLLLTSGTSNTDLISIPSATFTPTDGQVLLVACCARETLGANTNPDLTITNNHAGSWGWNELTVSNTLGNRHTLSCWYATIPSSPGVGACGFSSQVNCNRWEWVVWQVASADSNITNSITGVGTTTTPSVTLPSAPTATNLVIGVVASVSDVDGVNPGSGYTKLVDTSPATSTTLAVEYALNPSSTTVNWSGAISSSNLQIAFEVPFLSTDMAPSLLLSRRRRRR